MLENLKRKTKTGPYFKTHLCCFVIILPNTHAQLKLLTVFFLSSRNKMHKFKVCMILWALIPHTNSWFNRYVKMCCWTLFKQ